MKQLPPEDWLLHWDVDGASEAADVQSMLATYRFENAALQPRGAAGEGEVYVRLSAADSRLALLLDWLRERHIQPQISRTRIYRSRDLQAADWLWHGGSSSGVTLDWGRQGWDRTRACPQCGAGTTALEPLFLHEVRMPRGGLAMSVAGQLVATERIAAALVSRKLTGITTRPTSRRNPRAVREPLVWLDIPYTWPRFQSSQGWTAKELCGLCARSGYYLSRGEGPFELVYGSVPTQAPDFGRSFEQWGSWQFQRLGASPALVVSQRAFRAMRELGVRLSFRPVLIGDEVGPDLVV